LARQAVCISHATGAGGAAVGRAVAERLGSRYVDDEVIAEAAEWAELDPALVADGERRKPFVARLLGQMAEGSSPQRLPTGGWARTAPTDADLRVLINDVLRSFADRGSVVIVSHAASFALAGRDVLRVFVTASDETRARRVSEAAGTEKGDGARQVRKVDGARVDYLKRSYAVDRELPAHFDIVACATSPRAARSRRSRLRSPTCE
jgi:Cytidylate kinase-like family